MAMLRLVRRHAEPKARLLFSLFLKDPEHAASYLRAIGDRLASDDPALRERTETALARALAHRTTQGDSRFIDEVPGHPLQVARYEPDYALELVSGTGWDVLAVHPPDEHIQHYMICAPV